MSEVVDVTRVRTTAAALDNPVRVEMLRLLLAAAAYPGELSLELGVSPQQMTKHVAALQRGGLVEAVREGRRVRLELASPQVKDLLEMMSHLQPTTRPKRCLTAVRGVSR